MYKISWDSNEELLDSVDGARQRLDQLHEQYRNREPTLVTVERADSGDTLSIGLGAMLSVLTFVRGDGNPPYYTSAGGRDVDEFISFLFGGESSEYPLRAAVPIEAARAAIREF